MAYNNGFPIGYQPAQTYYPQPYQQSVQPVQQASQMPMQQVQQQAQQMMTPPTIHAEIVQVDSEQIAENYPLAAGSSQMMIARDDSAIYIKSMYANGQYNLDVFVKRPKAPNKPEINPDIYITREEFESRLKAITEPPRTQSVAKKSAKKESEDE